jgi:hypothetical protein
MTDDDQRAVECMALAFTGLHIVTMSGCVVDVSDVAAEGLAALLDAGWSVSRWRPIETAPRDRTEFDAWYRDGRVTNVYWSDIQDAWCVDGPYGCEEPSPLPVYPPLIYWMPLPEPPK